MFTNRKVLVLGVLSLLLVSLAVSQSHSKSLQTLEPGWPLSPDYSRLDEKPLASIPNTDFYQRHPELRMPGTSIDLTDYIMRHPELTISMTISDDLADYFFRHNLLQRR